MKTITRIISLFMVALILTTSVPFTPVSAVDVGTENYTLNMEKTYADSSLAESSAVGGMSFFGRTEFDGCYGNQLLGVAREIYDSLVENYTTEKITGEYTYAFETPFTFDAEISGSSIVMNDEFEAVELEIQYAVQAAMDAFLYDHPEVFWLKIISSTYGISASGNSVNGYTGIIEEITIIPTEIYSGASSKLSQYESAVDSVIDAITVTESRYETLKNIHDYICNNAWYNLVSEQRVHSSEPFFIGDGGVVCEGYAKTFKILCDRLEIPCVLVSGDAGGAHMWNYVQMDDGRWYLVDVTWDDQESKIYDTYFLANANTIGFDDVAISEERTERSDFSGTGIFSFTYPVLSATAYTVHIHEWDSDYTVDVEPTCTEKGSKSIHCKSCDETKSVTEIPATNHANKTEYAQQDATCTENGYTAGVYCSDCEKWLEGHDIITSEGHTDENLDVYCDFCNVYMSELVKEGKCGNSVTYKWYEDGTLIISGSGAIYNYSSLNRNYSPFQNSDIETVVITEGITSIGNQTFSLCGDLYNVILPESIVRIGDYAFNACDSLYSIGIPSEVDYIGTWAFHNCSNLVDIIAFGTVDYIGDDAFTGTAFYNDTNNYEDGCLYIGKHLIKAQTSIVGHYSIKEGTVNISNLAFKYCRDLESVTIPNSVTNVGNGAFYNCSRLIDISIPNSVLKIGDDAFAYCSSITNLIIPDSVTTLGVRGFLGCTNLVSVKIGRGITALSPNVFNGCTKLTDVYFYNTLTSIGYDSFGNCSNLKNIYYVGTETQWKEIDYSFGNNIFKGLNIKFICEHHNKTNKDLVGATCISNGYTSGIYCNDCNDWIEGHEYIDELGHSFSSTYTIDIAPTCTAEGSKSMHCTRNECTVTTNITAISATGHSYGSYTITKNATCMENGSKQRVCSECDYVETATVDALGHNYEITFTVDTAPTCTTEGSKSRHCTRDGCTAKTSVTAIPKLAHNYTNACDKDCNVCTATRTPAAHKGGTATCTKKAKCSVCGAYYGSLKAHSYRDVITKASLSKNGKSENKCTACGYVSKTTVIYAPKTVKLSTTTYTYNGKAKTPPVTVKDSKGKKLKNGTDYTVKYSKGRKSIGKYTVTVTFKGNYSGTKKITFEIVPAKVTLSKLTVGSKALTATWKTVSGATGYEVQYSTSKKFTSKTTRTVKIKSSKTKKTTIKKLTKGKKYYVRIRAYKTVSKKPVYGTWSSVKNIKVK